MKRITVVAFLLLGLSGSASADKASLDDSDDGLHAERAHWYSTLCKKECAGDRDKIIKCITEAGADFAKHALQIYKEAKCDTEKHKQLMEKQKAEGATKKVEWEKKQAECEKSPESKQKCTNASKTAMSALMESRKKVMECLTKANVKKECMPEKSESKDHKKEG